MFWDPVATNFMYIQYQRAYNTILHPRDPVTTNFMFVQYQGAYVQFYILAIR